MIKTWAWRIGALLLGSFISGLGLPSNQLGGVLGKVFLYGGIILPLWVWFGWDRTKVDIPTRSKGPDLEP